MRIYNGPDEGTIDMIHCWKNPVLPISAFFTAKILIETLCPASGAVKDTSFLFEKMGVRH